MGTFNSQKSSRSRQILNNALRHATDGFIGKKHALEIYDQFTLNTSCFLGEVPDFKNISLLLLFHEIFVTKIMDKLIYYCYDVAELAKSS